MKRLYLSVALILFITSLAFSQVDRIGAGLSFAAKKRFNGGDTGNPGINIKTWIAVDKSKAFHIVPSLTAYNFVDINHTSHITTNYMFQGDLDFQYRVIEENTLGVVAIAGVNFTQIVSKNEIVVVIPNLPVVDSTIRGIGPSIGAALEMRMSSMVDFILTAKYSFAGIQKGDPLLEQGLFITPLASPIIQIHAVYYFRKRGKGYSRR